MKTNDRGKRKLPLSLVALSSAVIVSVYAAGYGQTNAASQQVSAAASPTSAQVTAIQPTPTAPRATPTTPSLARSSPNGYYPSREYSRRGYDDDGGGDSDGFGYAPPSRQSQPSQQPSPSQKAQPSQAPATSQGSATQVATASTYRDGTYVGVGSSRHGSIQATVVIQGGKIVSADVTSCGTRYPCDYIQDLPPEVVARQSAQIDYVSGATDSSMAYRGAVSQALSQAS